MANKFSDSLRRLMAEKGITAKQLSRSTGIPTSTISEWTGGREPRLNDSILRVAKHLGVSLETLLTGESPQPNLQESILSHLEDAFFELHTGIYRIKIEQLKPNNKGVKK